MRLLLSAAVALALALALGAPALAQAKAPPSCFYIRDVGGRSVADRQTLYFSVMDKAHMYAIAYFRVTVGSCEVIPGSHSNTSGNGGFRLTTVEKFPGASARVCKMSDLKVMAATECQLQRLDRMTPEEVAAIPRRLKP